VEPLATILEPTIGHSEEEPKPAPTVPSVWGLNPTQLHDRYWACRGVQVVRQGERSEIVVGADLFLLTDPRLLTIFSLSRYARAICWEMAELVCVRLHDKQQKFYHERMVAGADGELIGFRREYRGGQALLARVFLTRNRELASMWQQSNSPHDAWLRLRDTTPRCDRTVGSASAGVYDRHDDEQVMEFIHRLVRDWKKPDMTIHRPLRNVSSVWADRESIIDPTVRFVGPVWIGAGRKLSEGSTVIGPAVLWDDPHHRPRIELLRWDEIQPAGQVSRPIRPRRRSSISRGSKRAFDLVMSVIGIALTLPLYPLVMLAIWLEDGRPFFFAHRRETRYGREFPCIKFRSMKKDAEDTKGRLRQVNQADGPHFFIEYDPRLTRVGRFLRKTNIDELPQLFNVLLGQMSLVGPRPSPYSENQFCPAWREARLSVRPGITGLWQVARTRQSGLDFQEWIKFDIEYVENVNWKIDLIILWRTIWKTLNVEGKPSPTESQR
jgi:lipopolysaccharide/colanic/teichoic acid biosynthesis glycosyltransferase